MSSGLRTIARASATRRAMPPEILKNLHADIVRVLVMPEIRQQLERQSMDVLASAPADFSQVIRREVEHWKQAVKLSGANVS